MDSEFIQVTDSQGNELQVGDKVLVAGDKHFYKRYVVNLKPSVYTRFDGKVVTYHSKVAIQDEDSNTTRWTYAYRVVKYNW